MKPKFEIDQVVYYEESERIRENTIKGIIKHTEEYTYIIDDVDRDYDGYEDSRGYREYNEVRFFTSHKECEEAAVENYRKKLNQIY